MDLLGKANNFWTLAKNLLLCYTYYLLMLYIL